MNNQYFIHVHDRNYTEYDIFTNDEEPVKTELHIDPIECKLFHNDVFSLDLHNKPCIEVSETRSKKNIPGVLILEQNRTYGRTENKKRLLYRCIPYDPNLPHFLIPYDIHLTFSKCIHNKYVLFSFQHWDSHHPHGVLSESLGDVHDVNALSEYELYGHHLQYSLKYMNAHVKDKIKKHNEMIEDICHSNRFKLQYKTDQYVFSIDPSGSTDFDDAFAVKRTESETIVTVHIANVAIWSEYLELWNHYNGRVSSIYLPQSKKPMLSPILSDQICSLQQKQKNVTMFVEFPVSDDGHIDYERITFGNSIVKVCKNFEYEEHRLYTNEHYKALLDISKQVDSSISNSHDVVSSWMIKVNSYLAKKLVDYDVGLLRSSSLKYNQRMNLGFSRKICDALFHYKNASSNYISTKFDDLRHVVMDKDIYTHVTSPIRRKVDLLNQVVLLYRCRHITNMSSSSERFIIHCMNNLDKINEQTKNIKYVQNKLQLIRLCHNKDVSFSDKLFQGIVVDKKQVDTMYHYTIYIDELHVFLPAILDRELQEYSYCNVSVFLFEDENNIRNKVKIQIV